MATIYWLGTATAVAQVSTVQITADNNDGTTYTLTVGSETVSTADTGNTTTTATNLAAAWNASTHLYFTGVTASSSTDTVTLTADTAGVPFTATSSVSGGTGTIGAVSTSTASAGPNDWSTAANWSGAAVPVNGDIVIIEDNSVNICWGLAQSSVTLDGLKIRQTYTGKIGLDYRVFATSADAATTDDAAVEYRDTYLNIKVNSTNGNVELGENLGPATPAGSGRICLDLDSQAANIIVFNSAASAAESGRPAIRLLAASASTTLFVRSAPGGVGVAADKPGETSTLSKISISDQSTSSRVFCGSGVTLTTWEQDGGQNSLNAAATVTTVTCNGGTLTTEGDYTITTANLKGGTWYANHVKGGGNAITTLNLTGGTIDATRNNESRTWATVNLKAGATIKGDSSILTITALNEGDSGPYVLSIA